MGSFPWRKRVEGGPTILGRQSHEQSRTKVERVRGSCSRTVRIAEGGIDWKGEGDAFLFTHWQT